MVVSAQRRPPQILIEFLKNERQSQHVPGPYFQYIPILAVRVSGQYFQYMANTCSNCSQYSIPRLRELQNNLYRGPYHHVDYGSTRVKERLHAFLVLRQQ